MGPSSRGKGTNSGIPERMVADSESEERKTVRFLAPSPSAFWAPFPSPLTLSLLACLAGSAAMRGSSQRPEAGLLGAQNNEVLRHPAAVL